jgi:hypothetical protein
MHPVTPSPLKIGITGHGKNIGFIHATFGVLARAWAGLGYLGHDWADLGYLGRAWACLGYLGRAWIGQPWAPLELLFRLPFLLVDNTGSYVVKNCRFISPFEVLVDKSTQKTSLAHHGVSNNDQFDFWWNIHIYIFLKLLFSKLKTFLSFSRVVWLVNEWNVIICIFRLSEQYICIC